MGSKKTKILPSIIRLDTGNESFDLVTENLGQEVIKEILQHLKPYKNDDSEFTLSIVIKHNPSNTQVEMKSNHNTIIPHFNRCTFDGFRSIDINETINQGIIELVELMP